MASLTKVTQTKRKNRDSKIRKNRLKKMRRKHNKAKK